MVVCWSVLLCVSGDSARAWLSISMSLMGVINAKRKVTVGRNEVSMQYSGAVCDDEGVGYSDGDGDCLLLLYVPARCEDSHAFECVKHARGVRQLVGLSASEQECELVAAVGRSMSWSDPPRKSASVRFAPLCPSLRMRLRVFVSCGFTFQSSHVPYTCSFGHVGEVVTGTGLLADVK